MDGADGILNKKAIFVALLMCAFLTCCTATGSSAGGPIELGSNSSAHALSGRAVIESHSITPSELLEMQAQLGVRDPQQDYNAIVDGHGTGLAPPTKEEWSSMAESLQVVDAVEDPMPLASSYDLSSSPYFPKIGNQGSQGSCAAWASTYYAYGFLEALDNGWSNASLGSTQQLLSPAWTYNMVNGGSDSGSSYSANMQVIVDWGVSTMAKMPYNQNDCTSWGSPQAFREAPLHRAASTHYIPYNGQATVDQLKSLVQNQVPVDLALDAYQLGPAFTDGNYIVSSTEYSSAITNHAQTIVGFNDAITDDGDVGAFRIANSWGSGWGDHGYYWLTYSALMEMGSSLYLYYITDLVDYQPSMLATWHFDASPNRDVSLELGLKQGTSKLVASYPYYRTDASHGLPSYLSLDISEFLPFYSSSADDFYLKVGSGSASGTISSFKVELYEAGYLPGLPTQVSAQASGLKKATPATVDNLFPRYEPRTVADALESSYIADRMQPDSATYANWVPVTHHSNFDGDALQSGDIGPSSQSSFKALVQGPSTLLFDWKVSSEASHDILALYVDGSQVLAISGSTNWSTESHTLTEGAHVLEWRYSKDASVSSNEDCGWLDHIVLSGGDVDPPVVSIVLPAQGALFNSSTVQVSWTGSDVGSGISRFETSLDDGTWRNESTGTSRTYSALGEGAHEVRVRVWDNASNQAMAQVDFIVDTVAPLLTVLGPSEGDWRQSTNIQAVWAGNDPLPGSGILGYEVRWDAGSWTSMGTSTMTSATLAEGSHSLQVKAFDRAMNTGLSTVHFGVDLTLPMISIAHPMDGALFNTKSLDVSWSGSDALSGLDHFELGLDGSWTTLGLETHRTLQNLGDGTHTVTIRAVDQAGNQRSDAVNFSIDTMAPTLILEPGDGAVFNSSTIQMSWQGADPYPASGIWFYWTELDGAGWVNRSSGTSLSLTLAEGSHTFRVRAFDRAMNSAILSSGLFIDLTSPTIAFVYPVEAGALVNSSAFTVSWTGSDQGSGIDHYELEVDGAWTILGDVESCPLGGLQEGAHSLTIKAIDRAGNTRQCALSFTVDTLAPIVLIEAPLPHGLYNLTAVTASWSASDPDPGSGLGFCWIRLDDGAWTNASSDLMRALDVQEGAHVLEVRAYDRAMNWASSTVEFIVDLTPPQLQITGPASGSSIAQDFIQVNWTASDALSDVMGFEAALDGGAWVLLGGNETGLWTGLSDGPHVVRVRAFDGAGNLNITSVSFTSDTTPPELSIANPSEGVHLSAIGVQVQWSAGDAVSGLGGTWARIDAGEYIQTTGTTAYTFDGLAEGAHVITLMASDGVGNKIEKQVNLTIDRSPPDITIIGPQAGIYLNHRQLQVSFSVNDSLSPIGKRWARLGEGSSYSEIEGDAWNTTAPGDGPVKIFVKVEDMVGNVREVNVSVMVDTVLPSIVLRMPALNSVRVNPVAYLTVGFSEAMNVSSVAFVISPATEGQVSWSEGTATFTPFQPLPFATRYSVTILGKDMAGNSLASPDNMLLFTTIAKLSGTVKDPKGEPIGNATVSIVRDGNVVAQTTSDQMGYFEMMAEIGNYTLRISSEGMVDYQSPLALMTSQTNEVGSLAMTEQTDWVMIIAILGIVAVIACLGAFYVRRRRAP
jgi:C1A family cysteine protease